MSIVGRKIYETRKSKGYSQEKLAELSKINLRTIQRIENNENEPHGKTLNLICDVLEINIEELLRNETQSKSLGGKITNWIFLIALNFLLMTIFSFLMIDSNANWNSRLGGLIFSMFIPFVIVFLTKKMNGMERMLKFGIGFIIYIILAIIMIGIQTAIILVIPFLLVALSILYYGNGILKLID